MANIFEVNEKYTVENYISPIHKNLQLLIFKSGSIYLLNNSEDVTEEELESEEPDTYESVLNNDSICGEHSCFQDLIYGKGSQLIIGSGLGTQARVCEKLGLKHKSIEICPVITKLFKRFNPTFDIVNADGFKFLQETDDKWGNIIIDAFNKDAEKVVDIFTSADFFNLVKGRCEVLSYNLFYQEEGEIQELIKNVSSALPVEKYIIKEQEVETHTINFILSITQPS